jgi:hypothetical protein
MKICVHKIYLTLIVLPNMRYDRVTTYVTLILYIFFN